MIFYPQFSCVKGTNLYGWFIIIIFVVSSTYTCSISELRDYSGCILFDEYQVGLLVQDLTKIVALRPGEEGSCSTISSTPMYVGLPCACRSMLICYYIPYCWFLLLCRPSRSCTPLSQVHTYIYSMDHFFVPLLSLCSYFMSSDYYPGPAADYSYSQSPPWLFISEASWQAEWLSADCLTGFSLSFITVVNSWTWWHSNKTSYFKYKGSYWIIFCVTCSYWQSRYSANGSANNKSQ